MMYIKIQGTIVLFLTRASFFLSHYMLPPAEKVLSKLPAPPTRLRLQVYSRVCSVKWLKG